MVFICGNITQNLADLLLPVLQKSRDSYKFSEDKTQRVSCTENSLMGNVMKGLGLFFFTF